MRLTDKQLKDQFERLDDGATIDCRSSVMDRIKCGQIRMRSRLFVLTQYLGLRTTWVVLVLTVIAIINLNLFMVSRSPVWNFTDFGRSGWWLILAQLPYGWWAFALAIMVVAIIALRRFSFSYLWPFQIFAVLLVMGIFVISGFAFAMGVNDYMYRKLVEEPGESNSLLAKMYCFGANRGLRNADAELGEILDIPTPTSFVVQTPFSEVVTVVTQEGTIWPGHDQLKRFQVVKMMGHREKDVFTATRVKIADDVPHLVLNRDESDCLDKQVWAHKQQKAQKRRDLVQTPFSPATSMMQLIMSVQ